MTSAGFTIAAILTAAFHGPTWAWVLCAALAGVAMFAEA